MYQTPHQRRNQRAAERRALYARPANTAATSNPDARVNRQPGEPHTP